MAATPSGSSWAIQPSEITVDRALCVPESFGPEVSGLPSTPHGFLPTGVDGRVLDTQRVWALGDAAQRALKHSIITAAEADAVASSIIETLGLGEPSAAPLPALHGILVDAPEQRWWEANSEHLHDGQMASDVCGGRPRKRSEPTSRGGPTPTTPPFTRGSPGIQMGCLSSWRHLP